MPKATKTATTEVKKPIATDLQVALDEAQMLLYRDRRRAHATLFGGAHRRSHTTPDFHWQMIDDFHSDIRFWLGIAFRGAAKTTIAEEGAVIKALFREARYFLIGSSISDIAEMRLHAIKRQFETNESILEIFGNLKSKPWEDNQIELSNGVVFRAIGRGQGIRGTKDEDIRPDFMILDDIEDKKAVANETQIKKTLEWFDGELIGSADEPNLKIRMLANDMGPDCLANKLKKAPSWTTRVYPWIVNGKSIWEDRYPLASCLQKRQELYARGSGDEYEREYMCNSTRPEAKTFRDDFLKVEDRVRLYDPVYAMILPSPLSESGLEVSPCAAAVWSWINEKIIVWECWSRNLQTDKIVSEVERIDAEYHPVKIGFAKPAFEAWGHASLKLPAVVSVKIPTEELDFVRALQPFFVGKQIIFAQEPGESWQQFLGFPGGPFDAASALACALHDDLRHKTSVYEDFTNANVTPDLLREPGDMMLAINADENFLCAIQCQVGGRGLRVFANWMIANPTVENARDTIQAANLSARQRCQLIAPASMFERGKDRIASGLRKMGLSVGVGGDPDSGRRELQRMLREQSKGLPRVLVSASARWARNALLAADDDGPYHVAIQALESLVALAALGDPNDVRTNAISRDGREFFSARPRPGMTHG